MDQVIIIGGGFAGLSAAVRLAERGHAPVLLERQPKLGGRAYSFRHGTPPTVVDNGQHVLMRCCRAVRGFLKTIGAEQVHFEKGFRIPFTDGAGNEHELSGPAFLPARARLLAAFLKFGPTTLGDAIGLRRVLPYFQTPPDDISVAQWLDLTTQSRRIRNAFWHPLCRSVMNAAPEDAPVQELLAVLAEAFDQAGGADMGWATAGLSDLYVDKARAYLEVNGGSILNGAFVEELLVTKDCTQVSLRNGKTRSARTVVLAVPPPRAARMLPTTLSPIVDRLSAYTPSPILGINLWFEREIIDEPFIGLLGLTIEWIFNRTRITGKVTARGHHVSLVVSASTHLLGTSDPDLVEMALMDLRRVGIVELHEQPLHSLVVHEKQATFVRPPGTAPVGVQTTHPGLFLAGDWTDTGLPPTIEGAVRSGNRAADLVIDHLETKKPER